MYVCVALQFGCNVIAEDLSTADKLARQLVGSR